MHSVRSIIAIGRFSELDPSITTDARNWRLDPDKAGGGILVDHGWHAFYLVIDWMGADPSVGASLTGEPQTCRPRSRGYRGSDDEI